jgi:enoyl-[acyl-carrier protein] reductase II
MIESRVCDILSIKYPVIQGGMAWISTAELVAAVEKAGGIGVIAAGNMSPEHLREEIVKAKEMIGTNRFGVNMILLSPVIEEQVKVVCDEKPLLVTLGAGTPGKYIDQLKSAGIIVMPVVASILLAKRAASQGADAIIVEGTEAGGHIGDLTTMVLVPQVADEVDVPVIAAGGIADGRGIAAALCLGAEGVQIGTRFCATKECIAHSNYKDAIIKAQGRDMIVTGRVTGHPVRVIANKFARTLLQFEKDGVPPDAIEMLGVGKLRAASREGDINNGSVMAGQISGMIEDLPTVQELMERLVKQTKLVLGDTMELIK